MQILSPTLVLSLLAVGCAPAAHHEPATAHQGPEVSRNGGPSIEAPPASAEAVQAPEPTLAQQPSRPPGTFDLNAIDDYVSREVKDRGHVGLSLAILVDGKVVLAKGYGKRSLASGARVEVDTPFAVGSITKQFACAAALLLSEEGKLSLDDKVARYYPELTKANEISLYDLFTHVSGYPDHYPLDFMDGRREKPTTLDALIGEYAGGELDFEPRTRWSYSNTGYLIAGRVVEKVAREPLGSFLERRIFKPLGMDRSVFLPKEGDESLALGYGSFALGEPELAPREADGWIHADGGLYSTATDLARWNLGLMEGRVLKPRSYARMTAPRKLGDGTPTDYGCGLMIGRKSGEPVLEHSGSVSGFRAFNAMVPRTRSSVTLLSNLDSADIRRVHDEVLSLLLKAQGARSADVPRVEGPPARECALDMLHQMQSGVVDRARLSEEFSHYLSDEKLRGAAARIKALGEPEDVVVENVTERGGMEHAVITLVFKGVTVRGALYRTSDGKIQQFLLDRK